MASVLERALLKKIYTLLYSSALPSSVWANEDIENVSLTSPYSVYQILVHRKEIKSF